ncbi:hypothetical protein [Nonomuraea sediminis]|uniref:hypothetical protein n=1 Tax=Nonomuraea sediminis TaxID=2835864 RepID=UPI001BDBCD4D|nr:hypothetical protein [Nonomuraea sediminis]
MKDEQARRGELQRLPIAEKRSFDRDAFAAALRDLGDLVKVLGKADSARKAKICADIGIEPLFDPSKQEVLVSAKRNQDFIGVRGAY